MAKRYNRLAAQGTATWIWFPGDWEIWLGNRFNNRRTERGAMFPPFWKQDSHWPTVEFSKSFVLEKEDTITIAAEGDYNLMLDGKLQFGMPRTFTVPTGEHRLALKVHNQATPPAIFIKGDTVNTNETWLATYEDKIWIDENGQAHGSGIYVPAGRWRFDDINRRPSQWRLEVEPANPTCVEEMPTGREGVQGYLADFGRETMGYVVLGGLSGSGSVEIYYGESREEALDKDHCETLDILNVEPTSVSAESDAHQNCDKEIAPHPHHGNAPCATPRPASASQLLTPEAKAFRFVYIETPLHIDSIAMLYEYLPVDEEHSGSFRCSDAELNRIWDVGARTMDLTTREFFLDGIKRDRWTWSGDAVQSYLMNYFLRFDSDCVKRTIRQLRGKDPVTAHVNTIMDYTFYWFRSMADYYLYSGDADFVREMYPRMQTLMDYCLSRTDDNGMAAGRPDDWIFVDWVDFPMHKRGVLCFEQILFCQALDTMAQCAELVGDTHQNYAALALQLWSRVKAMFWDPQAHAFLHAVEDGTMNRMITKFPNMFAIIYGYVGDDERRDIMEHVMLNPDVERITTPYMRFYELEALCMDGRQSDVIREIKDYWGGMLRAGATSFWEKYIPEEQGAQHLAMYGRPYGKSLCHAWGASPVYLLGKYILGVRPTQPGYAEYEVCPSLGTLEWVEGAVPTPFGLIRVKASAGSVTVLSDGGRGTLIAGDRRIAIEAETPITYTY